MKSRYNGSTGEWIEILDVYDDHIKLWAGTYLYYFLSGASIPGLNSWKTWRNNAIKRSV